MSSEHSNSKPMVTDIFVKGAVHGWQIATSSTIPNVLMAFVLIKVLNHSGLLTLIGKLCDPLMGVFGLPGEAATILLGAWMSMGGGVGVAVALFGNGLVDGTHLAIVTPAIFLMGSQLQYMGRCLGVIGIKGKDLPLIMCIPIITAFVSLFVMRLIVLAS
ncbi:MAG: YjiG family protein [Sutterella sp.]|nr:YjiG family protein [Sutterella sp.]